jgi:hypothetical protein
LIFRPSHGNQIGCGQKNDIHSLISEEKVMKSIRSLGLFQVNLMSLKQSQEKMLLKELKLEYWRDMDLVADIL